ncbi:hypothetical protein LZZ85_06430 [Terrimonas sp. NA20]|uniref:Lipocalin-like domain-containing protein n=1 Tax=Terrimonas ginsenosidimutans TaxID=2908004 RepID=A0ABS9KNK6_9BACT|nr:hypothetical protein [Terrimonas ginsenosidimutans]MCG2613908.1 hypothetical protein [Terrimonas ginsenosidimutans]
MKLLATAFFLLFSQMGFSQSAFPAGWAGAWKGDLFWYNGPGKEPKKIDMQLRIQKGDTCWTWQMTYGKPGEDNRPYSLIAVDSAKGHWAINEHNGIVLDQYFLANRLTGAFTVGQNTIINSYELRGDSMIVEFNSLQSKPITVTGLGTEDSPKVDSYRVQSFQRAVLRKFIDR